MTEKEINFNPPPAEVLYALAKPLRNYFEPQYFGLEHIDPDRPSLYVANHTVYGAFDIPLYCTEVYKQKGIILRTLGDHFHYVIPGWRDLVTNMGVVRGTRDNCSELMERGQHVLVFPGGSREVCKQKGEENTLVWKRRTGFARMAIENDYPILPFAALGPDEAYEILIDSNDIMNSVVGKMLNFTGWAKHVKNGEHIPPISRGLLGSFLPKPEKFYFGFGTPIDTSSFKGHSEDPEALFELRSQVEHSINDLFDEMKAVRAKDTDQKPWRKFLKKMDKNADKRAKK